MEVCRYGGMEVWRYGEEVLRYGSMEAWRYGGMALACINKAGRALVTRGGSASLDGVFAVVFSANAIFFNSAWM